MINMATPSVKWHDSLHNPFPENQRFDFGTVTADEWSEIFTFNIWNNKDGKTDLPKLEKCTITTRDDGGGEGNTPEYDVPVVADNWFHCQVDSLGETDLLDDTSKIGKIRSKNVGTTGSTTKDDTGALYPTPITPAAQEILGVKNNGQPADSAGNFATVTLRAKVPLLARSGKQEFKVRFLYQYV